MFPLIFCLKNISPQNLLIKKATTTNIAEYSDHKQQILNILNEVNINDFSDPLGRSIILIKDP